LRSIVSFLLSVRFRSVCVLVCLSGRLCGVPCPCRWLYVLCLFSCAGAVYAAEEIVGAGSKWHTQVRTDREQDAQTPTAHASGLTHSGA
jgi:hypothetical protein